MSRRLKYALLLLVAATGLRLSGAFTLPVERTVAFTDNSGESWREEGTLRVSAVAARQMWEVALRRDGWRFVRTIALDESSGRVLDVWEKHRATLLLCVWSIAPGVSGYMWGTMEKADNLKP